MQTAWALLAFCSLALSTARGGQHAEPVGEAPLAKQRPPGQAVWVFQRQRDTSQDFYSQTFTSDLNPGFPKTIKINDPGVLKAARHSVERFNNCTNDIFLFKESHVSRALVQIVKGLKYMLDMEIGRTSCKKTKHPTLDDCDFQANHTLKLLQH